MVYSYISMSFIDRIIHWARYTGEQQGHIGDREERQKCEDTEYKMT